MTYRRFWRAGLTSLALSPSLTWAQSVQSAPPQRIELEPNEHVVVIGNTFAERVAFSGYFDALAHSAHPDHHLVIRAVPWSADEVDQRPREMNVPTTEMHLADYQADVIVMCFGMAESFAGADGLAEFEDRLAKQIDAFRAVQFNGASPPRLILVSPIGHEDLGAPMVTGAALAAHNEALSRYTAAMRKVSAAKDITFVDLFAPSDLLYQQSIEPLTSNGIHPNELGCFHFVKEMGRQLGWLNESIARGTAESAQRLRTLAYDAHYHFRLLYRATNTEYVWGRRAKPFGVVNFPPEMEQLREMIQAREAAMWAMDKPSPAVLFQQPPTGPAVWEQVPTSHDFPEDAWIAPEVEAKGTETSLGSLEILPPEEFAKSFTLPDGYSIDCFASEQDFAELQNPLAMTFDVKGRLWVACTPTYPHLLPGQAPRCKLLIIEDTDGDGHADRRTVFADNLYIPTGFAVDTDAVYVGQAPDLWKLTDTDGDDRADRREIVASGFGMPDSHHQVSAFEWDPNGGFMFHEGVFTKSNVETPYGVIRTRDAAAWRYDPRTQRLEVMSHCGYANPWGHVFDDYGQSILADASGGDNFSFSHVITGFEFPRKPSRRGPLLNRGRPTAGCELISSRQFPSDVQGSFLVNQSIGFHGTRWDRIIADGSAWKPESMPQDLLSSSDTNFRPVAMEIGPDGALYIVDWCNPLIGHMQYSVRDPRRDHTHGRVWRIQYDSLPLVEAPNIVDATVPELLELLRLPERNTRQLVRRQLQKTSPPLVIPELRRWMAGVPQSDPLHDRLQLEGLWIHQALGRVDFDLLDRVATLADPQVRAGALRVLRHWLSHGEIESSIALPLLERGVRDDDMRVRLEAVLACGFVGDVSGAVIAASAAEAPMDDGLRIVLQETLTYLGRYGEPDSALARQLKLERIGAEELLAEPMDELVAATMLVRTDVAPTDRERALAFLEGDNSAARVHRLIESMLAARQVQEAANAVAPLLAEMSPDDLRAGREALTHAASHSNLAVRAIGIAALLRLGEAEAAPSRWQPAFVTDVLERLEPGEAPPEMIRDLRTSIERGAVEPVRAIRQVVRHATDQEATFNWMVGLVEAVDGVMFDQFHLDHEIAMAALRHLNQAALATSLDTASRLRVPAIPEDLRQRGRAIYMDEVTGCVRCHGAVGRGEEGFPPLDHSPWILGNPQRAAAIVTHGLVGQVQLPDGRVFESMMEPLGAELDDESIAAVLSFIRQSWGNYASAVSAEDVRAGRSIKAQDGTPLLVDDVLRRFPLHRDRLVPPAAVTVSLESEVPIDLNRMLIYVTVGIVGTLIIGYLIVRREHHHS